MSDFGFLVSYNIPQKLTTKRNGQLVDKLRKPVSYFYAQNGNVGVWASKYRAFHSLFMLYRERTDIWVLSCVDDLIITVFRSVMDWANKKHHGRVPRFGVCTSKKMEETKFEDLTVKLGYPYVYTHQGNCEHLLIFRDLRMLHTDDPQSISNYPFQIFRPRPKRQICMICSIYSARWLTRGDPLMSEDPSLFCEKCFKSLHYNKNQKAYAFRAYQYSGDYYW